LAVGANREALDEILEAARRLHLRRVHLGRRQWLAISHAVTPLMAAKTIVSVCSRVPEVGEHCGDRQIRCRDRDHKLKASRRRAATAPPLSVR
jgi:hypothetical protein